MGACIRSKASGSTKPIDELAIRAAVRWCSTCTRRRKPALRTWIVCSERAPAIRLTSMNFTRRSLELSGSMRERPPRRDVACRARSHRYRDGRADAGRMGCRAAHGPGADSQRQDAIASCCTIHRLLTETREHLRGIYDMERLLARVTTGRASPRDLQQVARTLKNLPPLKGGFTAGRRCC